MARRRRRATRNDGGRSRNARPLARYVLGRTASVTLWVLRVFVLIITALVAYTFVLFLR